MTLRSLLFLLMLSLTLLPACPADDDDDSAAGDDDDATGDDDDATGDDDDATGDDDDATGDDDDATGDDDDATGDDDDSAGDDDDSAGDDDDSASADADGDGVPASEDCNDGDNTVYPGAVEQCGSGVDEDCDAATNCDDTCLTEFDFAGGCNIPQPATAAYLHWPYETEAGGTTPGSGTSMTTGTWTGTPTLQPGFWGNSAVFDGTNWIFAAAALTLPTDGFTFMTWVRADAVNDNSGPYHFLASSGNGQPAFTGAGIYLSNSDTTGGLLENQSGANEHLPSGPAICDDKWAQVALVFDQGTVDIYVDGTMSTSTANFTDVVWGARPFGVANDPNNLSRAFTGELDETMVFDTALTSGDIDAMRTWAICNRP